MLGSEPFIEDSSPATSLPGDMNPSCTMLVYLPSPSRHPTASDYTSLPGLFLPGRRTPAADNVECYYAVKFLWVIKLGHLPRDGRPFGGEEKSSVLEPSLAEH